MFLRIPVLPTPNAPAPIHSSVKLGSLIAQRRPFPGILPQKGMTLSSGKFNIPDVDNCGTHLRLPVTTRELRGRNKSFTGPPRAPLLPPDPTSFLLRPPTSLDDPAPPFDRTPPFDDPTRPSAVPTHLRSAGWLLTLSSPVSAIYLRRQPPPRYPALARRATLRPSLSLPASRTLHAPAVPSFRLLAPPSTPRGQ
ncbi:hypothetical protein C8F04DRAFT_1253018 [Mycena alexandri]|uniref:Uncharacterized protein n=1 Tax=Mycena alexandri TaxID=1745969 RepID=A0AAD6T9F3_9AGAR|nr:hypothetical protein C8F04DRAFT_1253018 [Mycena alexandri]